MKPITIRSKELPGNVCMLSVTGHLNSDSAERLQQKIDSVFESKSCHIFLDLSQCKYISSSGISVFFKYTLNSAETGNKLGLLAVSAAVKKVLALCGGDAYFLMGDTLKDLYKVMDLPVPAALPDLEKKANPKK